MNVFKRSGTPHQCTVGRCWTGHNTPPGPTRAATRSLRAGKKFCLLPPRSGRAIPFTRYAPRVSSRSAVPHRAEFGETLLVVSPIAMLRTAAEEPMASGGAPWDGQALSLSRISRCS